MKNTVVRCGALLLGLAAVWAGLAMAQEPYRNTLEYRHAKPCEESGVEGRARSCVGREDSRVADKSTRTTTAGSTDDSTRQTHYYLSIERGAEGTKKHEVSSGLYDAARRGSRAELEIWRGQVVGITVRDSRDRIAPAAATDLMWRLLLSWAGAGLVLWAALGRGRLRELFGVMGSRAFAWMWLGAWTAWPASRIAAHGMPDWGMWLWSALWLLGVVLCVPFLLDASDSPAGVIRRWRHRGRARTRVRTR
ncbi:hypothetical protein [Streptomyces sp. NPDC048172]|uniref:hypothetical protein n=1 Tax=Streptomyces sp. NPDC048172 TaxID=3365505 RepID=UPI0037111078